MRELKWVLENGFKVDVKELVNGEIQLAWAENSCFEIISKVEAIELGLIKEENSITFGEWLSDFESKNVADGAVLKVENKKAQSMLNLKVKKVQMNSPRIVSGRQGEKIPWVTLENDMTFRIRPLQTGCWKVVNL